MNEIFYLCIFNIDGNIECHLYKIHEKALDDFKDFVDDIKNDMDVEYTDDNGHTYSEIMQCEYFCDGLFSARIEELELYD